MPKPVPEPVDPKALPEAERVRYIREWALEYHEVPVK